MVQELVSYGLTSSASEFQKCAFDSEFNDVSQFKSKRIKLSLHPNQQVHDFISSEQASPLGLTLNKTPSFLNLVEMTLSEARTKNNINHAQTRACSGAKMSSSCQSQFINEKLKASNLPALSFTIGSFKRISRNEEDIRAKYYYAKKKIVWEVLEGPVKSKMEIQWGDIEAIRATIQENRPGVLEIEINQPPLFFKETNPQPRKHTLWQPTSDFTLGQALKCRRHIVQFPPGTLDKHYEKLLQCDHRLLQLSRKPFPSGRSPYFQTNYYSCNNISFALSSSQARVLERQQAMPTSLIHHLNHTNDSHYEVLDFGQGNEVVQVQISDNRGIENWIQDETLHLDENQIQELPVAIKAVTQMEPDLNNVSEIDNFQLHNPQFVCYDKENIVARLSSMWSSVNSPEGVANLRNNVNINYLDNNHNIQENFGNAVFTSGMVPMDEILGYDSDILSSDCYYQYNGLSDPMAENFDPANKVIFVNHQWS